MKIEHLAIWVNDLELMKDFYVKYFDMACGNKYTNSQKQFSSYFLSFKNGGTRIELMHREDILPAVQDKSISKGFTHFAISTDSKEKVNELTEQLRTNGYNITGEPRTTGDGYYESVVSDPEGNSIEITV